MVNYTYNAWGEIISTTGTLASTIGVVNKLRYRSYYYDSETGFYYLQSRYYDPVVKRFISPDSTDYLTANGDFDGYNLYAYCVNNPVMYVDCTGEVAISIAGKVIAVSYAIFTVFKSASNYKANKKLKFEKSYIDSQKTGNAAKVRMGLKKGSDNGCGWIATFNALLMLGKYVHPKDIVLFYELSFGAVLQGTLGVNPLYVAAYFVTKGYSVKITSDMTKMASTAKQYTANILLYFHSGGAHYIALRWSGSKFVTYNCNAKDSLNTSICSFINSKGYFLPILISIK